MFFWWQGINRLVLSLNLAGGSRITRRRLCWIPPAPDSQSTFIHPYAPSVSCRPCLRDAGQGLLPRSGPCRTTTGYLYGKKKKKKSLRFDAPVCIATRLGHHTRRTESRTNALSSLEQEQEMTEGPSHFKRRHWQDMRSGKTLGRHETRSPPPYRFCTDVCPGKDGSPIDIYPV